MTRAVQCARDLALLLALMFLPVLALAQDSKSAGLAVELARLLDERKMDALATRGAPPDEFVAVLYLQGSQLLVVAAKYPAPDRLASFIGQRNFRDVYIDLNSASDPQSKVFISDLGANGLRPDRDGSQPWDTADIAGRSYAFDGEWGKAMLSRDDYTKAYGAADEQYRRMLEVLLAEIRKGS